MIQKKDSENDLEKDSEKDTEKRFQKRSRTTIYSYKKVSHFWKTLITNEK